MNIIDSQFKANPIIRRIFIVLLFMSFGCQSLKEKADRCQKEYSYFRKAALGIGQIETLVEPQNAVMTIVHVKQQHDSALFTGSVKAQLEYLNGQDGQKLIDKFYRTQVKINEVQREIVEFIMAVSNERSRIYTEGLAYHTGYRNRYAEYFKNKRIKAISEILELSKKKLILPNPAYYLGASFAIHDSKKRQIIGAEHGGLLNFTTDTYTNPKLKAAVKLDLLQECHHRREEEVLKNISIPDSETTYLEPTVKFLIFGSKHDFKDNVIEWNESKPDLQIRLVAFKPDSL